MGWKRVIALSLLLLITASCSNLQLGSERFSTIHYDRQCMTIDGHDRVIFSGAFHYFRCPKELWADRFAKIKAAGFNTVETYLPWNMCETQMPAGLDDYSKVDLRDVEAWLKMAEHFGFYIIIRPGPYICAEWEHGGFPGWLITKRPADFPVEKVWLRSDDPTYIAWCKHWYDAVCPLLAKHQITRKSPGHPGIILFQLENEYDYSGMSEPVKMSCVKSLAECAMSHGIDVPLFTCWTHSIRGNSDPVLSKIFDSCNFYPGDGVDGIAHSISELRAAQPNAPLMTTELQGGWFTGVGEEPPLRPDSDHYRHDLVPAQIQNLTLFAWQNGETITNYYMLFGGTNFADDAAQGISTSYDYSSPIRENGGVGEKYRVVQSLGQFIHDHGPSLARAVTVDCQTTTGFSDVSVVERRAPDGGRYIFLRTSQHSQPRNFYADLKETLGRNETRFDYHLDPFGSKVLYLPPGIYDPARGQWFPQEPPVMQRPTQLPSPILITDIRSQADPDPAKWKTMSPGQHLPELGIYDSRFVYYDASIRVSAADLADNKNIALKIEHASGDHVLALLNDRPIQPIAQTAEVYFSPGSNLRAGENHLRLLYENTGFANIGGAMEKRAGVSRVTLTPLPTNQHAVNGWQMRPIPPTEDPAQLAALAADNGDAGWQSVSTDHLDANQLSPHRWAIFRAIVDVSADQLNGSWTYLNFSRIDDEGWIFVNGQQVGRGLRWDQPVQCDARPALHTGKNIISVIIHNNDGAGGLGLVNWAPEREQTIGDVSALRYYPKTDNLPHAGWSGRSNPDSLLTWHRLDFALPKQDPHIWVPWLLRLHAAGNGFIYLNGHALGRYWQDGRQSDYFLPECWLHFGGKNVILLSLRPLDHGTAIESAKLLPYSIYAESR